MKLSFFLIIFCTFFHKTVVSQKDNLSGEDELKISIHSTVEVCAKAGCVRGKVESGRVKPYEAFYGIPYAEPPVGKLRFENPVPYEGWTGYWDATYPRDACKQKNVDLYTQPIVGSEDCLYLNIYRPIGLKNKKTIPVMIFIHGGSWLGFSSSPEQLGPEYIMDNGEVILVTLNYRLGLFGLLCSGDKAVKGNFAFKDQQLAMKWVVDNIEFFGGDINSITLAGQSAGAASVHLHIMNPISQAFFHRAILMSGTAINPWSYVRDFKTQFREAAKFVGLADWETASTYELAKELKKVNAVSLVNAVDKFFLFISVPPLPLGPCIEGDWEGAFLQEDPRILWAEGRYISKPILIGTRSDEGVLGAIATRNETLLAAFNANIDTLFPILFSFDPRYIPDVLKYYFGDQDTIDASNEDQFFQMITDRLFVYPLVTFVKQFIGIADVLKTPIFIYEFGFKASFSFLKIFTGYDINLGVTHFDDLFYLFTMSEFIPIFNTTSPEGRMVDVFVRTVVNFATRGEVKNWRRFRPCTLSTSVPSCDRQIFQRYKELDPNQVVVSVTNEVDVGMMKLWYKIDNGINAITQDCS